MSFKHKILSSTYRPRRLCNNILSIFGINSNARLRVLLYHDIAPEEESLFSQQLCWLRRSWDFVTPLQFSAMLSGDLPLKNDSLLLTFDDGFASNRDMVAKVLNPMGIKALFFVVSDFVGLVDENEIREFIATNIYPYFDKNRLPKHLKNMSWNDLEYLLETGHSIGSHTLTHAKLSQCSGETLLREITRSGDVIQEILGVPIEHFAYTFGDVSSFSPEALELARRRYRHVYTGLRGFNTPGFVQSWAIRRDSLTPNDSLTLVGAFLQGNADFHYRLSLQKYESWGLDG